EDAGGVGVADGGEERGGSRARHGTLRGRGSGGRGGTAAAGPRGRSTDVIGRSGNLLQAVVKTRDSGREGTGRFPAFIRATRLAVTNPGPPCAWPRSAGVTRLPGSGYRKRTNFSAPRRGPHPRPPQNTPP